MSQVIQRIRQDGMQAVLSEYGFTPNRSGFIKCPFHAGDKTGSLKIYAPGKGWNCFGCHRGGSAIDFVMLYEQIPLNEAVSRLKSLLGIEQSKSTTPKENTQELKLEGLYEAWMQQLKRRNDDAEFILSVRFDLYCDASSKPDRQRTADQWTTVLYQQQELPYEEYLLNGYRKLQQTSKYDWIRQYKLGAKWTQGFDFYIEPWMD